MKRESTKRVRFGCTMMCFAFGLVAHAAWAERVDWDYSPHPPLAAIMTMGDDAPIYTRDHAPKFVLTRFVVRGESSDSWDEVFDVLNTMRRDEPKSPGKWYEKYRKRGDETCAGEWSEVARSEDSLTFERRIPACAPAAAQTSFNRVLYGRNQVFLLTAAVHGEVTPELRGAWLAVLASARVSP